MQDVHMHAHHLHEVITHILLFFGIAGVAVPLLQRLRLSPVVGYLLCGIAIGPYGLSALDEDQRWLDYITIKDIETVQLLGELGIVALMFMIGLELSFKRLKELRRFILGLGSAQIVITALVIIFIARLFDNSLEASILIGASLALSSTAIVMKLLETHQLSGKPIGILCFSILLMQDLAVVPIVVLASTFAASTEGSSIALAMLTALGLGTLTIFVIYVLGRKIITPLLQSISFSTTPEWLIAFSVFIVVGCAAITSAAGLSLALGAFLAGLLIAETDFRHEVEVIITPLKDMLLGIFFLSIGMQVNIAEVVSHPLLIGASVLGIYAVKAIILMPIALAFRIPARQAAEASLYLAQPGEFALLIFGVALTSGLMPAADIQFFLLVTTMAMMLSPLLFRLAPLAGQIAHRLRPEADMMTHTRNLQNDPRILIAGMGRVGELIAVLFDKQGIASMGLDMDMQRVQELKQRHMSLIYGDARKREIWQKLLSDRIEAVVIALDDAQGAESIIRLLKTLKPALTIIARAHNEAAAQHLQALGASEVIIETQEASIRIAQLIIEKLR